MAREVVWKLVVDETGAVKRMEEFGKEAEKSDKTMDKTKKSTDEAKTSIKGLGSAFGDLKNVIGMAAGALGLGGMAYGLKDIVSKTMEVNKESEHFSSISGLGARASMDYTAALKARGVGTEAFGKAFKMLGKNIQTAERQQYSFSTGQEKARMQGKIYTSQIGVQAEALQKLGISTSNFKRLSPEKQFETITKKLEGMKSGLEKTTLMADLFGRGAQTLSSVFQGGSLGLTSFLKAAKEYFPIVHGGAKGQEELIAQQEKASMAWEGLEVTLGEKVAPAMTKVYGGFAKIIGSIEQGHGVWGTLEHDLKFVSGDLKEVYTWVSNNKTAVDLLSGALTVFAGLLAVEEIVKWVRAIKSMFVIEKLTGLMRGFGTASAGAAAGEDAAAGGAMSMGGQLFVVAAALFAAQKAIGKLTGGGLGETAAEGKRAHEGLRVGSLARRGAEGAMARDLLANPQALAQGKYNQGLSQLSPFNRHWLAEQLSGRIGHAEGYYNLKPGSRGSTENALREDLAIAHGGHVIPNLTSPNVTVPVYIDGRKVAEAFVKNPNSQRYLGEAAEKAALVRNARR